MKSNIYCGELTFYIWRQNSYSSRFRGMHRQSNTHRNSKSTIDSFEKCDIVSKFLPLRRRWRFLSCPSRLWPQASLPASAPNPSSFVATGRMLSGGERRFNSPSFQQCQNNLWALYILKSSSHWKLVVAKCLPATTRDCNSAGQLPQQQRRTTERHRRSVRSPCAIRLYYRTCSQ